MNAKKRRKTIWVATIVAAAVFAVSAIAAGANVSGYERLKAAGFSLLEQANPRTSMNGTYRIAASLSMDGAELASTESIMQRDGDHTLAWNTSRDSLGAFADRSTTESVTYNDNDVSYYWWQNRDGSTRFSEFQKASTYRYYSYEGYSQAMSPSERRFVEALADALVGDTRNYFVTDGNRVSIALSGNQIPELAQFALAAFAERFSEDISSSGSFELGADARFSQASLIVDLDDAGNATGGRAAIGVECTVNGVASEYMINIDYDAIDIGTTQVTKPEGSEGGKPPKPAFANASAATAVAAALAAALATTAGA